MTKLFRTTSTVGLCLFVLLISTANARAQSDETATSMARERFKEGVQYFDQKQYDRARVAFLQAYALKRHPAVLLNLAQSELRSGHEADAAKHFSAFLREAKDATPEEREGAEAGLFAAKAVCGELALTVDAAGAKVLVDGEEEGTTPLPDPLYVTPGTHQIEVRKDGQSKKTTITAKAGEALELSLRLGTDAARGGSARREPMPSDSSLPPEYDSAGTAGGGREGFFTWFGRTPLAWVGGGLTVLGVAGGVGFGLSARQSYDDADAIADAIRDNANRDMASSTRGICTDPAVVLPNQPPSRIAQYEAACTKHQDNVKKGDTMKTLSIVSWAVAGAAAAGTIVYYFADAGDEESETASLPQPRVGAVLGPGYLGLKGSF